jgi:hypothetical protein
MRWLAWIAIGAMHAACSSSSSTPDAQMTDAAIGGLVVELVAKNGVPQTTSDGVDINYVLFGAKTMRVIGDAAPGDLRTTRTAIEFEWMDTPAGPTVPIPHLFEQAPPGMYSTLDLRVGDSEKSDAAILIRGRVSRGGNVLPFEVQSLAADLPVAVSISMVLPPRALATLTIELDVAELLEDIDWDAVPLTGEGRVFLGDGDPQMSKVTSEIAGALREYKRP